MTHISAQGEVRYVKPPVNTNAHVGWYDVGHTKRHFPTRPIVWDEVMYEGDVPFWGGLTAAQMADRFWWGLAYGVYVGHGETLTAGGRCYDDDACVDDDDHTFWWSKGGTLRGESPSRIRWFRTLAARLFDDVSCTCSAWGGVGSAAVCDDGRARPHKPGDGVAIATDDATFFVLHAAHLLRRRRTRPPTRCWSRCRARGSSRFTSWRCAALPARAAAARRRRRQGARLRPLARRAHDGGDARAVQQVSSSTCCAAAAAAHASPYVFVLTREPFAWPPPRAAARAGVGAVPPLPPPLTTVAKAAATVAAVDPTGTGEGAVRRDCAGGRRCSACCCASRRHAAGGRRFERVRQGEDTGLRNGRRAAKKLPSRRGPWTPTGALWKAEAEDFERGADFKFSRPARAKRNGGAMFSQLVRIALQFPKNPRGWHVQAVAAAELTEEAPPPLRGFDGAAWRRPYASSIAAAEPTASAQRSGHRIKAYACERPAVHGRIVRVAVRSSRTRYSGVCVSPVASAHSRTCHAVTTTHDCTPRPHQRAPRT